MTNFELAAELREWARNRDRCNGRRIDQGKAPLDSQLLLEAAQRLEALERIVEKIKALQELDEWDREMLALVEGE